MKLSLIAVALALFGTSQVNALRVPREQHEQWGMGMLEAMNMLGLI